MTHMVDSILKKAVLTFSKWPFGMFCEQYYNMTSFPVWLQIQYGQILQLLDRLKICWEQLYFRLFKIDQSKRGCLLLIKQILIK